MYDLISTFFVFLWRSRTGRSLIISISFGSCIRSTLASELFIHEEVRKTTDWDATARPSPNPRRANSWSVRSVAELTSTKAARKVSLRREDRFLQGPLLVVNREASCEKEGRKGKVRGGRIVFGLEFGGWRKGEGQR